MKVFKGYKKNYCLWIEKTKKKKELVILDKKGKLVNTIEINEDIRPLQNNNFLHYFGAVKCFPVKDPKWPQRKRIVFIDIITGDIVQANKPAQEKQESDWVYGTDCFFVGGRTYLIKDGKIKIEQHSRIPTSEISSDGNWVFNPVSSQYGNNKQRVRIEFYDVKEGTMVDVEQFSLPLEVNLDIGEFSFDAKLGYFINGLSPAVMDLEKKKIINFDMVGYKNPEYFGFYLEGERYAVIWDFYYFEIYDKKKRKVRESFQNTFSPDFIQVLDIKDEEMTGYLFDFDKKTKKKDIKKLFSFDWDDEKSTQTALPIGIEYIEMDGRKARFFVRKGQELVLEEKDLKGK